MPGYACRICKVTFSYSNMLKNHMVSHRNILTEDQMTYAIQTAASFADEIAASGDTTEPAEATDTVATAETAEATDTAEAAATEVHTNAPSETEDASDTAAENERASTSAAPLQCTVCRKKYHYPRALQTHLAKSGHGQVEGISVVAPTAEAGAVDAQSPGRDLKAELDIVAHLLNPFKGRESLLDDTPHSHMDGRMIVMPHISDDLGTRLEFAKSLQPIGLPQFDNKATDYLFYEYMIKNRVIANVERHNAIDRLRKKGPVEPGECFFCRKKFESETVFYKHAAECSKLTSVTCQYCDLTFNNSMTKSRHIPKCGVYRMCAAAALKSGETPEAYLTRRKAAEDFTYYLLEESLVDPAMHGVSLFGRFSLNKYNEWMKQHK